MAALTGQTYYSTGRMTRRTPRRRNAHREGLGRSRYHRTGLAANYYE